MVSLLNDWALPARPTLPRQPGAGVTQLGLSGEITVNAAISMFAAIRAARSDSIEITIASGGGNALCALGLFELLIIHPYHVAANIARASSGAALVAMGADLRRVAPGAKILVHETRADLKNATADDVRSVLADLDLFASMSVAIVAAATGHTPEQVAAWKRSRTTFDARAAIAVGLAHELIPPNCKGELG